VDPHCDVLLVGDSLGMVSARPAIDRGPPLEMMILHGQAVDCGAPARPLLSSDMPLVV